MEKLELMDEFFAARVDGYDEHMIANVGGCKEGYIQMAQLVPEGSTRILDLGCGTGLELDEIFKYMPDASVVGIDMTQAMLDRLREKHGERDITLICGDYFTTDFGADKFDCAISFQTMHHFSHEKKTELYAKIRDSLADGGVYIECDYMVTEQAEEDFYFAENERLRRENNIPDGVFCHYDTPCTVDNQIMLL